MSLPKSLLTSLRHRFAGIIGNLLEHYDNALFGLLAPFIAPLFFPEKDPLTALIYTYGMLPLGLVTRPLGSLFFGWIGDSFGRRQALFWSLLGMSIVTVGIGCLPVYAQIGAWAPFLLCLGKMLQSFCAAGEAIGGAIFVLEHTPLSQREWMSGCYDASSVGGFVLASSVVGLMGSYGLIEENWRILFWAGGTTAFFGFFLRWKVIDGTEYIQTPKVNYSILKTLKDQRGPFFSILIASGFLYTTYFLAFNLMNGYIPLITNLSKTEVMHVNTLLLMVDLVLLPCFGYLAGKIGKERMMLMAACSSCVLAIPLFSLLDHANLTTVIVVRFILVLLGLAFAAPYYAWAIERVSPRHRYLILSLGGALGSQLIGAPSSAISLWLYKTFHWSGAPAFYLLVVGIGAAIIIRRTSQIKNLYSNSGHVET